MVIAIDSCIYQYVDGGNRHMVNKNKKEQDFIQEQIVLELPPPPLLLPIIKPPTTNHLENILAKEDILAHGIVDHNILE